MFKKSKLFFIITETPLHPGSGGEVTGLIDFPIQRERHTNFPKIEASGLKGCIREAFRDLNPELTINGQKIKPKDEIIYREDNKEKKTDYLSLVFGPEDTEEAHAGALIFTDARILLFPVKSLKGVFTWITCPMVLERFKEDLKLTGENFNYLLPEEIKEGNCWLSVDSTIIINDQIVLEEYTFKAEKKNEAKEIAKFFAQKIFPKQENDVYKFWREKLEKDLVILSDDEFEQFVTSSTEVITRTRIDDVTGTVKSGALWTEEYLPQDTILYSIAMASPVRVEKDEAKGVFKAENPDKEAEKVLQFFEQGIPDVIQIGGNQTIGKGIVRIQIMKKEVENDKRNNNN
jgi:CRISPR-associated protein Cmr4